MLMLQYLAGGSPGRVLWPQLWRYQSPDWLTGPPGLQHLLWPGHGTSCKKTQTQYVDQVALAEYSQRSRARFAMLHATRIYTHLASLSQVNWVRTATVLQHLTHRHLTPSWLRYRGNSRWFISTLAKKLFQLKHFKEPTFFKKGFKYWLFFIIMNTDASKYFYKDQKNIMFQHITFSNSA